jgi:hypothetical protein
MNQPTNNKLLLVSILIPTLIECFRIFNDERKRKHEKIIEENKRNHEKEQHNLNRENAVKIAEINKKVVDAKT